MRRPLHAGLVAVAAVLASTGTAVADPAHNYAGSRTPRSERHRVPADSVFSAKHYLTGPDVSNHNGCAIDWARVAARRAFAFMKATEDNDFVDVCFAQNWRQSKAVGLPRGAYDFAHPHADLTTARSEAALFIQIVKASGGFYHALPPVLDVEVNDDGISQHQMRRWIRTWIGEIHAHTKRKTVIIYTGNWFWQPNVGKWKPKGALLWAACYCSTWKVAPVVGWKKPNWWQYTDGVSGPKPHKTPGIGYSDSSFWLGRASQLKALTQKP